MESKNLFLGGFDKDIAHDKLQPIKYFDALNMRIVTDEGGTSGNLQNIKGNLFQLEIPTVPAIWQTTIISGFSVPNISTITVTINTTQVIFNNLLENFVTIVNAINSDPTFQAMGVRAFTNEGSIYDAIPTLYITLSSGILTFVNVVANNADLTSSIYANGEKAPRVIGWVTMREEIILFTTNSTSATPINSLGQIWRLTYSKLSPSSNIELLYNNYINTSLAWPIANPTMIEARYETPSVQNVYWTDNYNPPRVVNIADPMLYSLDPRLLSINSIVSPFIPIPQRINQSGGALKTGIHYLAYRLANNSGGETSWFCVSYGTRIIERSDETTPIVAFSFTTPWTLTDRGYDGGAPANSGPPVSDLNMGRTTSKSITYSIDGIDINYERIEFAHIYKKTRGGTPEINIVGNEPIQSRSQIFTLTGSEQDIVPVSLEEFLQSNNVFTRVATLTAKDNYLFLGNVTTEPNEVDWDARAYRFNASGVSQVLDDFGSTLIVDPSLSNWGVTESHAAINPNDEPTSNTNYLYQANGITFGGEGPNIKYQFITKQVLLDTRFPFVNSTPGSLIPPVRDVIKQSNNYNLNSTTPINQEYDSPDTFRSYHSPYLEGFLKGYMRDEVYRFAIVFYDHSHSPMFAKWIGDIRMPHVYMPTGPTTADRDILYPITNDAVSYAADYYLDGNALGIRFTINNLDLISEQISGYKIVRSKRLWKDRTVLGQGIFQVAHFDAFSGINILPPPGGILSYVNNVGGNAIIKSSQIAAFYSPEFLFPGVNTYKYSIGDNVDIIGIYNDDVNEILSEEGGGNYGQVIKNYTHSNDPQSIIGGNTPYAIDETLTRGGWWDGGHGEFSMGPVARIQNNAGVNTAWSGSFRMAGGKCLVLRGAFADFGTGGGDFTTVDLLNPGSSRVYIANYKKNLKTGHLSSQYSGNTFSQRSTSEYISTNHYQPVSLTSTSYVNDVYGGDIVINIMDYTQGFWDTGAGTEHVNRYFPVETYINIELRQAITTDIKIPNKEIYKQTAPIQTEEFLYNTIFSHENDIVKYFPKPVPYLPQTIFDSRIYNSALPKINGELADAWRIFKPEDYIEVDSQYGPINALITHKNRLFFVQNKATGIYQTNEKALVQDVEGGELILGTGGLKQRVDYISDKIGSKHRFSFTKSPNAVFFFDVSNKRCYLIKEGLEELQGVNGFLQATLNGNVILNDNPFIGEGVTSTYDHKFNEFLITFLDSEEIKFTLVYNEAVNAFTSFYSFTPGYYINDKYNIFSSSVSPNNIRESLYLHNYYNYCNFYDTVYPAHITFIANDNPDLEKIFDNCIINTKTLLDGLDIPNETFDTFRTWNSYQDTGDREFDNFGRFIKRKWNIAIGGNQNNTTRTERIKSNYAFIKFLTNNLDNYNIRLESVLNKYRINPTMIFTERQNEKK